MKESICPYGIDDAKLKSCANCSIFDGSCEIRKGLGKSEISNLMVILNEIEKFKLLSLNKVLLEWYEKSLTIRLTKLNLDEKIHVVDISSKESVGFFLNFIENVIDDEIFYISKGCTPEFSRKMKNIELDIEMASISDIEVKNKRNAYYYILGRQDVSCDEVNKIIDILMKKGIVYDK